LQCVRALLALMVCVGALGAAPAAAKLVATPRFQPASGPVVAGVERVAWVSRRDDAVLDLWVVDGQGDSTPRRVQRFSAAEGERLRWPRLSASPADLGLKLLVTDLAGTPLRTLVYAGPFGEPLAPAAAIPQLTAPSPWRAVATRGCESAEIHTFSLSDFAGPPAVPACPLRLRSPLRVDGDRLLLGISCAGFRIACGARVVVRAGGRVVARGIAHYNHTTPPYAAASLPIAPNARLRTGARVRVTARISDGDIAYSPTRHSIETVR
jgi:hypothetical protein